MRGGAGGPAAGQQPGPVLPLRIRERHVSARIRQHPGRNPVLEPSATGRERSCCVQQRSELGGTQL